MREFVVEVTEIVRPWTPVRQFTAVLVVVLFAAGPGRSLSSRPPRP
ncbi:hypothetical protein [Actinomadura keratinilytica]